tara:strand:+ start:848 stop:1012 length:165 start_codon:yes stop_codon:yes gene_type:complete
MIRPHTSGAHLVDARLEDVEEVALVALRHHDLPRLELEALHVRDDLLEPLARHL